MNDREHLAHKVDRVRRGRLLWLACVVALIVIAWQALRFFDDRLHDDESIVKSVSTTAEIKAEASLAAVVALPTPIPDAALGTAVPTIRLSNSYGSLFTAADLLAALHDSKRTADIHREEFSVFAPVELCLSLAVFRNTGLAPLVESRRDQLPAIQAKIGARAEQHLARIAERCRGYQSEAQTLREDFARQLLHRNAPLSRVLAQMQAARGDNGKARAREYLSEVLEHETSPITIFFLRSRLAMNAETWVNALLPAPLNNDALEISVIAIEIATCRLGNPCGVATIARDMVCTRFGECDMPDVESSYRTLHDWYGLSFTQTLSIAEKFRTAISTRDVKLLIPN